MRAAVVKKIRQYARRTARRDQEAFWKGFFEALPKLTLRQRLKFAWVIIRAKKPKAKGVKGHERGG